MDVADITAWCTFIEYIEEEVQGDEEGVLASCRHT